MSLDVINLKNRVVPLSFGPLYVVFEVLITFSEIVVGACPGRKILDTGK